MNTHRLLGVALAASLAASPSWAQTLQVAPDSTPATAAAPTIANTAPTPAAASHEKPTGAAALGPPPGSLERNDGKFASDENPVLTDQGRVRASRVIGSAVYNDQDQKIGTIDDIVLGQDKPIQGVAQQGENLVWVVISVGGFLGIDSKLVAVPYNRLEFGNTHDNRDNRVLMPGATKAAVGALDGYRYTASK